MQALLMAHRQRTTSGAGAVDGLLFGFYTKASGPFWLLYAKI
jgi:hypothetical protein